MRFQTIGTFNELDSKPSTSNKTRFKTFVADFTTIEIILASTCG